jgi:Tfp pilus assembly protein PilO
MKKISPTIQPLILFVLLTIAIGAADYFFYHAIADRNKETFKIGEQMAKQAYVNEQADSFEKLIQSSASQRSALEAQILPSDGFVPLVESIEALGKKEGVILTDSLGTSPDQNHNGDTEFLTVQIQVKGNWDAVVRTISLIESIPYVTSIDSISLTKDLTASTAKQSLWAAGFTLNVEKFITGN